MNQKKLLIRKPYSRNQCESDKICANLCNADGTEMLSYDYDFDLTGNLTRLENKKPDGTTIKSYQTYIYDLLGRINTGTGYYKGFTSDSPGVEVEKEYSEIYTFDDNNRMLKKTIKDGTSYNFEYTGGSHAIDYIDIKDSNNVLTGKIDFDYNDYGNMTRKVTTIGTDEDTMTFAYNNADEIREIGMDGNKKYEFTYDNKGQRLTKKFTDDAANIDMNVYINGFYSKHGENINKHISDGQYIVATLVENDYTNVLYYTQNNIGSTSMLTDISGAKVQAYLYTPYGEPWITEDAETTMTNEVTRKFTGQEYDKESELYYYNARYYDPKVGMFLTPDPAMSGLNHYAYCSANPINYVDPTGLTSGPGGSYSGWSGPNGMGASAMGGADTSADGPGTTGGYGAGFSSDRASNHAKDCGVGWSDDTSADAKNWSIAAFANILGINFEHPPSLIKKPEFSFNLDSCRVSLLENSFKGNTLDNASMMALDQLTDINAPTHAYCVYDTAYTAYRRMYAANHNGIYPTEESAKLVRQKANDTRFRNYKGENTRIVEIGGRVNNFEKLAGVFNDFYGTDYKYQKITYNGNELPADFGNIRGFNAVVTPWITFSRFGNHTSPYNIGLAINQILDVWDLTRYSPNKYIISAYGYHIYYK